jgi:hypothetical protein
MHTGALPVFLESSTPALSTLLSDFNSKILLPRHLTGEQQKLVYRLENKAKLEAEPVEITLGDVTLALEHLDRNRQPRRWQTFRDVIAQSETREDWENVVRIMEGLENAGIKLGADKQAMVVRRLNLNGMHHIILKALQRAKATGLHMRDWKLLRQVLRAPYDKAALSDWDEEETAKALRFAKQAVELLEDEEHCAGQPEEQDFRGNPVVIAVPTALTAILAHKHDSGNVQEVKTLAGRLMAALKQDNYTVSITPPYHHFPHSPPSNLLTLPLLGHPRLRRHQISFHRSRLQKHSHSSQIRSCPQCHNSRTCLH